MRTIIKGQICLGEFSGGANTLKVTQHDLITIVDKEEPFRDLHKAFNIGSNKEFLIVGESAIGCYIFKIDNNKLYAKYRYEDGAQWKHYRNDTYIINGLQNGSYSIIPIKQVSIVTSGLFSDDIIIVEKHINTETFEISMYGSEGWNTAKFSKADFIRIAKDIIKGVIKNPLTINMSYIKEFAKIIGFEFNTKFSIKYTNKEK